MTEEEVREWLEGSRVKATDVSFSDNVSTSDESRAEDDVVEEAVDTIISEYNDPTDVEGSRVFEVCEDLNITYKAADVAGRAKEKLENDD